VFKLTMSLRRSPTYTNPSNANGSQSSVEQDRKSYQNPVNDVTNTAVTSKDTTHVTLYDLGNMPKPSTPMRRASSAGPLSQMPLRRTPGTQSKTPNGVQSIGGSVRRPTAVTPHGRAAIREVEARRAGLTPGKDRRRSGRQQRETPRDTLRALSRLLAPKTERLIPTPPRREPDTKARKYEEDDLDYGPDPVRPRLSMPLDDDSDEDDSLLLPPRSAGIENEDYTGYSVELPRRAVSEQVPGRLSRGSFGSVRLSDPFGNLNEAGPGHVFDSSFAMGGAFDDEMPDMDNELPREDTGTLRNLGFGLGRESDIRPDLSVGNDSEDTFVFNVPARDVPAPRMPPYMLDQRLSSSDDGRSIVATTSVRGVGLEEQQGEETALHNMEDSEESENALRSGMDISADEQDETLPEIGEVPKVPKKKRVKVSKHGIKYPSLPAGVVKKLATMYARTGSNSKAKINKDTLDVIMQASDWFFEQVSEDLGVYARHAGRKTIDESDMVTLMKRYVNPFITRLSLI